MPINNPSNLKADSPVLLPGSKVMNAIQRLEACVTRMAQRQPHVKYSFDRLWQETQEGRDELAQILKRLQELEGQS